MDPFTGEICPLPYVFAPAGWAYCNGQTFSTGQNPALYSIVGNTFGGSATQQTFALPNLQAAIVPMGAGSAPGLTPRQWGVGYGSATVQLTGAQLPSHTHATKFALSRSETPQPNPQGNYLAGLSENVSGTMTARAIYEKTTGVNVAFSAGALLPAGGGGGGHENRQPYLALNFCIALEGTYPLRP